MRLWSIHPKYLDTKGLVALWRESLLAKKVLEGNTKGYKHHPQLQRFRAAPIPGKAINFYLQVVWEEALNRGYCFDKNKFEETGSEKITVTKGQLEYEFRHLLNKLAERDPGAYQKSKNETEILPHPLFSVQDGEVEVWEIRSTI